MGKEKSLAAQSGALANATVTLPAVFQQPQERLVSRDWAPYITFAHPKRADEWNKLIAKLGQVSEGDMCFISQEHICKLDVAKIGWLCHKQYWAETNPAGEMLSATFQEKPHPFKEHVEAVVLVYFDDRIVPANVRFRTTKCPAAKVMSKALEDASKPEWGDQSPAHKETLVANQPFMRFYGEMLLGPSRPSRSSGLPYRPTVCTVKPTGVAEWRLLKEFCDNPESQKALDEAAKRFEFRIADVTKKVR